MLFGPLFIFASVFSEPVVLRGLMVPSLIGVPVGRLRLVNSKGTAIPFQIDEITAGAEYICPSGRLPNADSANGILARQDEIAFLWEDADTAGLPAFPGVAWPLYGHHYQGNLGTADLDRR